MARIESAGAPHGAVDRDGIYLDLPNAEEYRLRAAARLAKDRKGMQRRFEAHPWPFLEHAVFTLDQARNAIRKYPATLIDDPFPECDCCVGGCRNYLHHCTNRWMEEKMLVVPKTRRMLFSWTALAWHTWLGAYRPGSLIAIGSRKRGDNDSEGAAELVRRCKFILDHIPPECPQVRYEYQFCRLRFPEIESEIVAVAQGADQARQYTFTAYLADEMAFWEHGAATWGAIVPTLEGGGRFTGISSANPGFFKQLVFDELAIGRGEGG